MDWQTWLVTAEGTLTPLALALIGLLVLVLILREFAQTLPPRNLSQSGCLFSLASIPLLAIFLTIVVIRVVQILQS